MEHDEQCACAGQRFLWGYATDHRGVRYVVWSRCPGLPPRYPPPDPGPEMGLSEYLQTARFGAVLPHPLWPPFELDEADRQWCRWAARAIAHDPAAVRVSPNNPLAALVARYVLEYREE